jgi:hypothetical protein
MGAKITRKIDVFCEKTQLHQRLKIFLIYRDPVMPAILEERGAGKSR